MGLKSLQKVQLKESEYWLVAELRCVNYGLELNNEETQNEVRLRMRKKRLKEYE